MKKKGENPKVKRLNVDFRTPEEHEVLKQVHIRAAEAEMQIREIVIKALEQYVAAHDKKK